MVKLASLYGCPVLVVVETTLEFIYVQNMAVIIANHLNKHQDIVDWTVEETMDVYVRKGCYNAFDRFRTLNNKKSEL